MVFSIHEARNETNQLAKKTLPVRNPKDYVEYKWTRKDIANFCNAKDTKKLRRIVDNYIADGLDNSELVNRASELFNLALKEVIKTSELQFSLTTTLNNLLSDKNFAPFKDKIQLGNWINIKVDDKLYRFCLLVYSKFL